VDLKDSWPLRALRLPFQQRNARHIQGSQITLSTEECPPNQIRSTKTQTPRDTNRKHRLINDELYA